jgi:electron transfer flavoprotein alpha subunit
MKPPKRIDPRRAYRVGPQGLRRIVLGEISASGTAASSAKAAPPPPRTKPLRTTRTPDKWHMVVAHSDRGRLDDHAREAIACAAILAGPETGILVVVLGAFHEDPSQLGADRIAIVDDLDWSRYEPAREEALLDAFIRDYSPEHIFLPDNSLGDGDLGRRLLAKQPYSGSAHVREIDSKHVAIAWSSGARLAGAPLPRIVLLDPGAADPNLPFVGAGEKIQIPLTWLASERCRDLGLAPSKPSEIALEEAEFIVSAGNGVHNVATLEELARYLDAAVGASRVAVDDGKFPRSKQIGASGKTVSATTYLAVGISGAVQHLQGIKSCRHVIAINRDPGAPIVKRADLTVIADAEEFMQALITRVAQAREQAEVQGGGNG